MIGFTEYLLVPSCIIPCGYQFKAIYSNGVFFSTKKKNVHCFQKMQFCVCFLKMFRPLKGWYGLF